MGGHRSTYIPLNILAYMRTLHIFPIGLIIVFQLYMSIHIHRIFKYKYFIDINITYTYSMYFEFGKNIFFLYTCHVLNKDPPNDSLAI